MKCLFRKHKFIKFFDEKVGGIVGRHVRCKRCNIKYAILWFSEKPRKPNYKSTRIKTNQNLMLRSDYNHNQY